jgi:hypothetical protein
MNSSFKKQIGFRIEQILKFPNKSQIVFVGWGNKAGRKFRLNKR